MYEDPLSALQPRHMVERDPGSHERRWRSGAVLRAQTVGSSHDVRRGGRDVCADRAACEGHDVIAGVKATNALADFGDATGALSAERHSSGILAGIERDIEDRLREDHRGRQAAGRPAKALHHRP